MHRNLSQCDAVRLQLGGEAPQWLQDIHQEADERDDITPPQKPQITPALFLDSCYKYITILKGICASANMATAYMCRSTYKNNLPVKLSLNTVKPAF